MEEAATVHGFHGGAGSQRIQVPCRRWEDLPVEIRDSILHSVVIFEDNESWMLLMEVVLCFVCREWKERKPCWQNTRPPRIRSSLLIAGRGMTAKAASLGNLSLLKWLRENGCQWDTKCFRSAEGNLEVMKWLKENKCPRDLFENCFMSGQNGNVEALEWARENGIPWNMGTTAGAAKGGHLEVLKWLRENGCRWEESTCVNAAGEGHFEVMKWAIENGCPFSEKTFCTAAKLGAVELMKWLKEKGCKMHSGAASKAAEVDNREVLMWLKEMNLWPSSRLCGDAAYHGHVELLK